MNKNIIKQLEIFPEYKSILFYYKTNKFDLMLLPLIRIYDVLLSSIGLFHILTYEIIFKLIIINKYLGKYNNAIEYINNLNINIDNIINNLKNNHNDLHQSSIGGNNRVILKSNHDDHDTVRSFIKFLQLKSLCQLFNNDSSLALKTAYDTLTLCEQQQQLSNHYEEFKNYKTIEVIVNSNDNDDIDHDDSIDIDLLSSCNTIVGICALFNKHEKPDHVDSDNNDNNNSSNSNSRITPDQSSFDSSANASIHSLNYEDAIGYLQISARWAKTPYDQLISLSNLGM